MLNNQVVFKTKFITPSHNSWNYYAGTGTSNSYVKYIKDKLSKMETVVAAKFKENLATYAGYMTERRGSAGLFQLSEHKEVMEIPKECNVIWDQVVSLDTEDGIKHWMLDEQKWIDVIREPLENLLKSHNMDPSHMQIIGSFHSNTGHPHVHIRINQQEQDPRLGWYERGKFKPQFIDKFKGEVRANVENKYINWHVIGQEKILLKEELKVLFSKHLIEKNEALIEMKNIIDAKENNKRISYASLPEESKNQFDEAYIKFIESDPEMSNKIADHISKIHKTLDEGYAEQELALQQMEDIDIRIKNLLIKEIVTSNIKTVPKPKSFKDFGQHYNRQVRNNWKSKTKSNRSVTYLFNQLDKDLINLERAMANTSARALENAKFQSGRE